MNELKQGFGRTPRHPVAGRSADTASMSLEVKEANARLIGEVLAFLGLLALLTALFFWRHISGYDFIRNGWIDLPSHVAAAWELTKPQVSHVVPSEYRHDPHEAGIFMAVLWFVAFSAILRRRRILVGLILGFCLVPWPVFGLPVPGVGVTAALILLAGLATSLRHRDFVRAGMFLIASFAAATYFSLDVMAPPNDEKRPAVRFAVVNTPGAIKPRSSQEDGELDNMAALEWPENLAGEKAYLVAQDAFFRGEPELVAANLSRARAAVGSDVYANLRMVGLEHYLLSEGIGSPDAVSDYRVRRWQVTVMTDTLLGFGVVLIVVGLSIEWIAGRIRRRIGRVDALGRKIDASRPSRKLTMPSTSTMEDNVFAASLRRIRLRLRWALGVAAPFVIGGVALASLAFYLQVPSAQANDGFTTVHMLAPLFDHYPNGFDNVTANQRMLLIAPVVWPYYLGGLLALVLLGLRQFRLFLALMLLMTFGGQLASLVFPRSGVVEIAVSDFKPGTVKSIEAVSRGSDPAGDPEQARVFEAYHYTLAQLAYLAGDAARTAEQVSAVGMLDFWSYPSVEWRLAVMREWAEANGMERIGGSVESDFAMPGHSRHIVGSILSAALLLIGLGSPAILLALVYLWRRSRILDLQNSHAQMEATRRIGSRMGGAG
jgi:hypothetical protein